MVRVARESRKTIATAESCTGGLVAHLLTEVPGASDVYRGGWVVYANVRKTDDLFVPSHLIKKHGAVSAVVAQALAEGAQRRARSDHAVATTGIAGPTGGTAEKPVGLVWIGIATPHGSRAERHSFTGLDRSGNKRAFAERALGSLLEALQNG